MIIDVMYSIQIVETHMSLVHWMSNALLKLSRAKYVDQGGPQLVKSRQILMLSTGLDSNEGADGEEGEMKLTDFITKCAALTSSMDTFTRHLSM